MNKLSDIRTFSRHVAMSNGLSFPDIPTHPYRVSECREKLSGFSGGEIKVWKYNSYLIPTYLPAQYSLLLKVLKLSDIPTCRKKCLQILGGATC